MYEFPPDFDAKTLLGMTLEMLCFTKNQIVLHFDSDTSIVAEAGILHKRPSDESSGTMITIPPERVELLGLLEHKTTAAAIYRQRVLTLTFDTGDILSFSDLSDGYESYHVTRKGQTVHI